MVLIERLEVAMLPVHAWLSWRHGGGQYVSWSRGLNSPRVRARIESLLGLRQSMFEEHPGTYFEVQQRSSTEVTDKFCDRDDPWYRSACRALHAIKPHKLMAVALRKAMAHSYVGPRVKTAVIARELVAAGERVVLVPRDNSEVTGWLPADLASTWTSLPVPMAARAANRAVAPAHCLAAAAYAAMVIAILLLQRRVVWRAEPRHWPVAYDIYDEGFNFKFPYHETFIYDVDDLRADRILHVVRGRLRDAPTRQHFEKQSIPFVESGLVPIPFGYLWRSIFGRMLPAILSAAARGVMTGDSAIYLWSSIQTVVQLIRAEVHWASYQSDVFVGRDEYSLMHIVRTLVFEEHGARTVGFTHGDDCYPAIANSYQVCSHFCLPGPAYRDLHAQSTRFSGRVSLIGVGIYGLDQTYVAMQQGAIPDRYRQWVGKYRLVAAFGTSFTSDFYITKEMTLRFYRLLIEYCREYQDVILVLRPKGDEFETDEAFRSLLVAAGPKVILDRDEWTYTLLPVIDLSVAIVYSTVGLDALIAGRRAIYFDESGMRPFPYECYDPFLVAKTPEQLRDRLSRVLVDDEFASPENLERLQRHRSVGFDGRVVERFRRVVLDELRSAQAGRLNRGAAPW